MQLTRLLTAAALILSTGAALPALADNDRGERKRHDRHERHHRHDRDHDHDRRHGHKYYKAERRPYCPPGLVQVRDICVPRGQVRKYRRHLGVGDVMRGDNYYRIRDPRDYQLQQRPNWSYYRDDDQIYRVDNKTQTILAVMSLIQAFSGR